MTFQCRRGRSASTASPRRHSDESSDRLLELFHRHNNLGEGFLHGRIGIPWTKMPRLLPWLGSGCSDHRLISHSLIREAIGLLGSVRKRTERIRPAYRPRDRTRIMIGPTPIAARQGRPYGSRVRNEWDARTCREDFRKY